MRARGEIGEAACIDAGRVRRQGVDIWKPDDELCRWFSRFPGGLRKLGKGGDEQELGLQHKGNERKAGERTREREERERERLPCAYVIMQVESCGK